MGMDRYRVWIWVGIDSVWIWMSIDGELAYCVCVHYFLQGHFYLLCTCDGFSKFWFRSWGGGGGGAK